jgi:putative ABC transport system substrate-binding protein
VNRLRCINDGFHLESDFSVLVAGTEYSKSVPRLFAEKCVPYGRRDKQRFRHALRNAGLSGATMKIVFALSALVMAVGLSVSGADAQQPGKAYRIGYVGNASGVGPMQDAFKNRLQEVGYTEGQNLIIEWRFSKGDRDRITSLVAELVKLKVDCIVAVGNGPTQSAKQATGTIPIVMANADDDPVRGGLVVSLARPGGNVTGFVNIGSELAGKRLELLKETVPWLSRVAILRTAGDGAAAGHERETKIAAEALGIQMQSLAARDAESLEKLFQAAKTGRAEGLIIVHTGLITGQRERTVSLATRSRLPAIYSDSQPVLSDGLMSYSDDSLDRSRRVADYVDRILKGTKPADLPVQRPAKFELIVNLNAAKQIGLTVPANLLARADKIIK